MFHQVSNSYGNFNYNARIYKNATWEEHFHSNYELILTLSGVTEVTVLGRAETLSEGELILIPPYAVHSLVTRNARTWVGVFSEDFIPIFDTRNRYAYFSSFRASPDVMDILYDRLFIADEPERYALASYLYLILNECEKHAVRTGLKDTSILRLVPEYVSEHLAEDITLAKVAMHLGYEYHYFSSLFHECFAVNFKRFLNILRFNNACKLLSDNSLTVSEVADSSGFGSLRNFNRIFKELSGISPSEFRSNHHSPGKNKK